MEIKLLLAKAISAIYYASHSGGQDPEVTSNLIERTLEHLSLPDDPLNSNREHSALMRTRQILVWMKGKGIDHPYDQNDLMARLCASCGDNDRLYDLFCKTILVVDDPDAAKDKYDSISHELYDFIAVEDFVKLARAASHKIAFNRDKITDVARFRDELVLKLQDLPLAGKRRAASAGRCIDIGDIESLTQVYQLAQSAIDPDAILKLPFKAANRMTGEQDGVRRGEWGNVSALSGMNKSGTLLDEFISFCIFNTPKLIDETKKPCHVLAILEDKPELVLQKLYVLLLQHETGLPVIVRGVDPREIAEYVMERLQRNGWHVKIFDYTEGAEVDDCIEDLRQLQRDGYEIFTFGCDYPNLFDKTSIVVQVAGEEIQLCHRKLRKFTAPNNIYGYAVHQLSTQAKELSRQYPEDYIKKLPGKGYYEGCKKLDTEFDFERFVAKTMHGGQAWQEVQWGKHRKIGTTPEQDKYYALKFLPYPMMGFKYDFDLEEDLSFRKVGGRLAAGAAGHEWTDFD